MKDTIGELNQRYERWFASLSGAQRAGFLTAGFVVGFAVGRALRNALVRGTK